MTFSVLVMFSLLAFIFVALFANWASADFVLFLSIVVLIFTGILTPQEALKGFSNPGVLTIALLFIVSAAIKQNGNLDYLMMRYLGGRRRSSLTLHLTKMMLPLSFLSAFMNNTPIVATFTPVIKQWTERVRLPASKFLIPLSYATLFGGTCTLIGTSTNLLMHGLMLDNGLRGYGLFELAWVGIPCTIAGILYLSFIGVHLLPSRQDAMKQVQENPKEYVIEMKVAKRSPLVGKSIRDARLRSLRGVYLLEIERQGTSIGPVSSREVLRADDRLIFVGNPSAVIDLQSIPGLIPSAHEMFEHDFRRMRTHLVEAVVSSGSPALGRTVKEFDFRKKYGAGIVAVHRNGERIREKVGNIRLRSGDTLLLFTDEGFAERWKDSQDFYVVSFLKDKPPVSAFKSILTLITCVLMVALAAAGEWLPTVGLPRISIFHTALAAVLILLLTRTMEGRDVRKAIRWEVLFVIAFAIGISRALQTSGTADLIAGAIDHFTVFHNPVLILALLYFATVLTAELMTNSAAVGLAFPIATAAAGHLGVDPRAFLVAVTIAASSGFASPIGYQTHLIVQGPGGYKFKDYLKVGLPLDFLIGTVALTAICFHWSF